MKHTLIGMSALAAIVTPALLNAAVVTFESVTLAPESHLNQSSPAGGFVIQGTTFKNNYSSSFGSWSGFAISNRTDTTTPGFGNQFSAFTGSGVGGSANYAVGFYATYEDSTHINFAGLTDLAGKGASFTNTTYTALSMLAGDGFSKKFGGTTGNDADILKLTISGYAGGIPTGTSVDFLLADFTFSDNSQDYIVDEWTFVDFSALGTVDQLRFTMSSTDNGTWGMNTPAYFAMDNIAVPEPSALLCSLAGLGLILRRRR